MNDRFELFLEKATEMESMKSTAIISSDQSIRVDKIILAAMKQSNYTFLN
jgi:hypothetical protein